MSPGVCVFEVYQAVFDRVRAAVSRGESDELQLLEAQLEALVGQPRIAAAIAKCDAQAGREARTLDAICRSVCEDPCELHPRFGALLVYLHKK
jgi:hypothetical protein